MIKAEELITQTSQAQQPQIVYVAQPGKSGSGFVTNILLAGLIVALGVVAFKDRVSITPPTTTTNAPVAFATVGPGVVRLRPQPTAFVSVPQVEDAPVVEPQGNVIIVATSEPASGIPVPTTAPVAEPVQDVIVEPTPAVEPQYQLNPNVPHPELAAKTDGEFQGWGGGGGSGWTIPEPKADAQAQAQAAQPTSAPKATPAGWGGGGGSGWSVPEPKAENNGWSVGN